MWQGSRLTSLITVCLNHVNKQAGCGWDPLEDSKSSQFLVLLDLTLIPMVCTSKTPMHVPFTGTSCYIKNLVMSEQRKQMFPQHQGASTADPSDHWRFPSHCTALLSDRKQYKSNLLLSSPLWESQVKSQVFISKLQVKRHVPDFRSLNWHNI